MPDTPAPRQVDVDRARDHFERVLSDHSQTFEQFFIARMLDLSFAYLPLEAEDADKTACRIDFPVTDRIMNPQGVVHGGVIATVMDISMGHLLAKVAGAGATIEMKIQFMRPLTGSTAHCVGQFTKRGQSLSFMESTVTNDTGKTVAHATATWKMPE